mmetsp:Transcript_16594/g.28255  ORF Transcript_16594/g.28255 Transcript_16594/m.28255 type:complete len:83 (+) Transcript_16594:45-293(+)
MQPITQSTDAAVIEVDIKGHSSPQREIPVKQRLEKMSSATEFPPSLEEIEQKLKRAEEFRRENECQRKNLTEEKLTKAQERR